MNPRTRLKREIIRHRRTHPYRPTCTRLTLPGNVRARVVLAPPHFWTNGIKRADYDLPDVRVYGVFPPTPEVLAEIQHVARIMCWSCMGWGYIEIFHHSTDGLIGHQNCPDLNNPRRHPPAKPVPLQVETVPAHLPDCKGDNYLCCPPF